MAGRLTPAATLAYVVSQFGGGDILVEGPLKGAAMNPARAFGPPLVSGFWAGHLVYWIGPVLGAGLAVLLYDKVLSIPASQGEARGRQRG